MEHQKDNRVINLMSSELSKLWVELQGNKDELEIYDKTNEICHCAISLYREFKKNNPNYVPVIVLRGGLALYSQFVRSESCRAYGIFGTKRNSNDSENCIYFTDIPKLHANEKYLILDLIVNSGNTVVTVIDHIMGLFSTEKRIKIEFELLTLFSTNDSTPYLLDKYSNLVIYSVFDNLDREDNGWVRGVNFDCGDAALHKTKDRK